ncbi:MAG: TIGR04255 family protein [Treponema sp.]|nr:TIGR04255 family protein [Treponema sp.]
MQYLKAPVSEVVLGITFNKPIFTNDELFVINSLLQEGYPNLELLPPLNLEKLEGYLLQTTFDIQITGQVLYRRRNKENTRLIQVQQNAIYYNWIRLDSVPVGDYPGYDVIYNEYIGILDMLEKHLNKHFDKNIAFFDLTYHDRFFWEDYLTTLSNVNTIMDISVPQIFNNCNNIFSKYTYPLPIKNNFCILNLSTATSPIEMKQILHFESNIRGTGLPFNEWFEMAHKNQNQIFETIFKESLKSKWN